MADKTGGPAFPQTPFRDHDGNLCWPCDGWGMGGMTLRDWFAGQVIGHLAAVQNENSGSKDAAIAYSYADRMLEERER